VLRRNYLLKHVIEVKIEKKERVRRRSCKQLPDDHEKDRRYWNLKEEALVNTLDNSL
jgi:hypothetical protein